MSQNLSSLPHFVKQCHNSSTPSAPLTCDVIYGCALNPLYYFIMGALEGKESSHLKG